MTPFNRLAEELADRVGITEVTINVDITLDRSLYVELWREAYLYPSDIKMTPEGTFVVDKRMEDSVTVYHAPVSVTIKPRS